MATVLAIETSCDETAAAVVRNRHILSNIVASQIAFHQPYGGVVPDLASRQHVKAINDVVAQALNQAHLEWSEVDGIAVTCAPGLVAALLVGLTAAKTLAMLYEKPLIGIHHLEGHVYASYLEFADLAPPFLCLLVSGGHTSLVGVEGYGQYHILGQTRDDAVGEAFDKVARLLDLGYPGGPAIEQVAQSGNSQAFPLPEGNISLPQGGYHPYDSSFSGLKTAVLRLVEKLRKKDSEIPVPDIAASFQHTVARSLTRRTIACALDHGFKIIVVGGGVAANKALRAQLLSAANKHNLEVHFPPLSLCTDNAAMIGCAGVEHLQRGHTSPLTLTVRSRMPITEVMQLYQI